MVGTGLVAAASRLATPHGWRNADQHQPGDVVWAAGHNGQLLEARVLAVSTRAETELTWALTRVGDLLATQQAVLAGASGLVRAGELSVGSSLLEAVSAGDLPASTQPPEPLAGLEGTTFTVPEELADVAALKTTLAQAGVDYTLTEAGGWVAIKVRATNTGQAWSWTQELALLEALTIWPDGEHVVRRTRSEQRALRTRLIEAMMETGSRYDLRWVPTYFPVEARINRSEVKAPAFTKVVAVRKLRGAAVELQVEHASALLCDRLYLRLADRPPA